MVKCKKCSCTIVHRTDTKILQGGTCRCKNPLPTDQNLLGDLYE